MGGIALKLLSALEGFWWSLDEHERRMLLLLGVWTAANAAVMLKAAEDRRREQRLVDRILGELHGAGR